MRRPRRGMLLLLSLSVVRAAWLYGSGMRFDVCRSTLVCLGWSALALAAIGAAAVLLPMAWLAVAAARTRSPGSRAGGGPAQRERLCGGAVCLASPQRTAFCAGILRPRVYVSSGLIDAQDAPELHAVVEHERAHAARRDPLRRLLRHSMADLFFSIPLLRFFQHLSAENAELAADRAAIAAAGAAAVAGALALTDGTAPRAAAAFDGAGPARVAQLLGDPIPPRRPSPAVVAGSLAGLVLVGSLAMCLGRMFTA